MKVKLAVSALAALMTLGAISVSAQEQSQIVQNPLEEFLNSATSDDWRRVDPENLVYMDLPSGTIIIELRPDLAPGHVERIKTLVREGFYDNTVFHRVIEGFMAQGGDPTATGTGGSDLPDLQGEFVHEEKNVSHAAYVGRDFRAARIGFIGPVPVGAQPSTLPEFLVQDGVALWGLHCPGVMSMARAGDPNSANSQFFLMFGDRRDSLDQRYTVWGRIIDGFENARRINRGEPPARPTPIVRMRMAADMPAEEKQDIEVLRTDTDFFKEYMKKIGRITDDGFINDVCGVVIPLRINGKVEL